jgi:4'-phosphopantetheinyl transferase
MSTYTLWSSGPAALSDDEVHVWRASLDFEPSILRHLEATLSDDEIARAARFHFPRDRDRFVAARSILRALLGAYLKKPPARLNFKYGPHGKPSLQVGDLRATLEFNLSHSHGLAVYAFSFGREVGIDVELIRPELAVDEIADRYFSTREIAALRALPQDLRARGFFNCWTRKEAYVKARGEGLQIPLESFDVSLTPGEPPKLESADSSRWSLLGLEPTPRYVAALVAEANDWQLRQWNWTPEPPNFVT